MKIYIVKWYNADKVPQYNTMGFANKKEAVSFRSKLMRERKKYLKGIDTGALFVAHRPVDHPVEIDIPISKTGLLTAFNLNL